MDSPLKVNQHTVQAYLHERQMQPEAVAPRRRSAPVSNHSQRNTLQSDPTVRAATTASSQVLTPVEQTTLEALFGSFQKSTPEFYGSASKANTLYKGSLLDIKG